jgi:hypothetical protein
MMMSIVQVIDVLLRNRIEYKRDSKHKSQNLHLILSIDTTTSILHIKEFDEQYHRVSYSCIEGLRRGKDKETQREKRKREQTKEKSLCQFERSFCQFKRSSQCVDLQIKLFFETFIHFVLLAPSLVQI